MIQKICIGIANKLGPEASGALIVLGWMFAAVLAVLLSLTIIGFVDPADAAHIPSMSDAIMRARG